MSADLDRQEQALSVAWDRLLAGELNESADLDPGIAETLRRIAALETPTPISKNLEGSIWTNVIAGTAELWRPDAVAVPEPASLKLTRTPSYWILRLAWMVLAGFGGGFLAGVGSRLAMRAAGFLTEDRNRFRLTENGNRVGEITFDGTLFLGILAGALGVVTVLLYVLLRSRLPFSGWRRSASFAVLLLAVFGYVIMDPGNDDYHLFGPAWLNVSIFSLLYLLMGFFTSQIYEWGVRHEIPLRAVAIRSGFRFPLLGLATGLAGVGLLISVSAMIIGAPGLIVVGLGVLAWLTNRFAIGDRLAAIRAPALVQTWGLMVVPGIIGFVLTARGIAEILTNR
jgi:hypothetical protein